ncbi:hypothetical protein [Collinsella sp. An2]|uniref:hypothetical protein n=1 Tax=Collinsella sp. An2 TaxID=1965585 RepID=UPI000B564392|nr:hypothetical protein [Collinsella sp. An2]OUP06070.1 hypothetical protein B5F33_10520 [Collinsella sp. An2]
MGNPLDWNRDGHVGMGDGAITTMLHHELTRGNGSAPSGGGTGCGCGCGCLIALVAAASVAVLIATLLG